MGETIPLRPGQVTLTVHKARQLEAKGMLGKADPYVVLTIGNTKFKSKTINDNHNPEWNFITNLEIYEDSQSQVTIEIFDDDLGKDDMLGRTNIDIQNILAMDQIQNQWVPLQNCKSGEVLLSAEFKAIDVVKRSETIQEEVSSNAVMNNIVEPKIQDNITGNGALGVKNMLEKTKEKDIIGRLKLIIHRGKKLEKRGMFGKADPYIIIRYLDAKLKSKTVKNSVNPDWDFTTNIDIIDESDQEVLLQVFDDDIEKDDPMGQAIINLKEFKEKGSILNQWIRLEKCKSGQILISGEFNRENQDKQKEDENKESTISTTYTEQRYEEPGLLQQNEEMDKRSQKEITPIQIEEKTPTSEYEKTDDTVSSPKKTLEAGQICITVYKARDIEKRGKFGKADPYVKMTLGNQKAKSATVKNNHNPEWNFKATFDVDQNTTQNINIAVFDDDFGKDDSLGSTLLDISKVQEHHQLLNQWIPLEKCKSGAVLLSAEFIPVEKVKQQKQMEADKNNKEEVDNLAEFATQEITKKDN